MSAPYGVFTLDPRENTEVVLLAGGIGISPLLSMLKAIEKEHPRRKVTIAHAVRDRHTHPSDSHNPFACRLHEKNKGTDRASRLCQCPCSSRTEQALRVEYRATEQKLKYPAYA